VGTRYASGTREIPTVIRHKQVRGALAIVVTSALWSLPSWAQQIGGQVSSSVGASSNSARVTAVGDNRDREDPLEGIKSDLGSLSTQLEEAAAATAPVPISGGEGAAPEGDFIGSLQSPASRPRRRVSWQERVDQARKGMSPSRPVSLVEGLESDDEAAVFSALSFEAEGAVRYREAKLATILSSTKSPQVAKAAAVLLASRGTPAAYVALERHVSERGAAQLAAAKALLAAGPPHGRRAFLQRASNATGDDQTSLIAVRALAGVEGPQATQILRRLTQDWSEEVRQAAEEGLTERQQKGIPLEPIQKPISYGASMAEILRSAPEYNGEDDSDPYAVEDAGAPDFEGPEDEE
jgi:hypothetical protein